MRDFVATLYICAILILSLVILYQSLIYYEVSRNESKYISGYVCGFVSSRNASDVLWDVVCCGITHLVTHRTATWLFCPSRWCKDGVSIQYMWPAFAYLYLICSCCAYILHLDITVPLTVQTHCYWITMQTIKLFYCIGNAWRQRKIFTDGRCRRSNAIFGSSKGGRQNERNQ